MYNSFLASYKYKEEQIYFLHSLPSVLTVYKMMKLKISILMLYNPL